MQKSTLYFTSLVLALPFAILGAMLKILHVPYSELLLALSLPFTLIYMVLALTDVVRTRRATIVEKLMWLTAFLFLSGLAGLLYYPRFRKNQIKNHNYR